jgi:PAS domain S-box-containing protein
VARRRSRPAKPTGAGSADGRYRAIVEDLPDLVCRFRADGTLTYTNPAYRRFFGLDDRGKRAGSYAPRVHPDDLPAVQALVASLSPEAPTASIENRVVRSDGSVRWTEWTNRGLFDAKGRAVEFQATGRDVTERRQAEEDAARLAAIVAGADDAIISKTLDGVITSWNPAAEAKFGYTAAEAVGQPITLIIPEDRLDEEREFQARLRRGEAIEHFETERRRKDGRLVSASISISPIRDARGRVIGASKILRDTTERRQVEGRLKVSIQDLEALYRLVDAIGRARGRKEVCDAGVQAILSVGRADRASVLVFDDAGVMRFTSWVGLSDGYRAATDGHSPWTRQTPDPKPLLVEDVATAASLGDLRGVIQAEGIVSMGFFPLEHQGRLLGKFMLYYDRPHAFSPEDLRLVATAAQHISQGLSRVLTEEAMDQLLQREQAARREAEVARAEAIRVNRHKDEFLAMLAHELRNPVGVIVNAISLVEQTEKDQGLTAVRAGAMIKRQSAHLSRLLDDLLDVSRITSGRIQMNRQAVDLGSVLDLAAEGQRHQIEGKRQTLTLERPPGSLTVHGDPVRLQQVIGNLLNNASKYSKAEGAIRASLAGEGPHAVLRVRDDGAGIPPDKLETIFELFAQANPSLARTEGGLGIGLTLVKRIVEFHGGTVEAHSEGPGRGAELVVRIPMEVQAAPPEPSVAGERRAAPRRILVIEDHPDGREALAALLAVQGHHVLTASTGQQGIGVALEAKPDVILVDIGLPDVDGYEVARRLRARLGARSRLLALTGYGQPEDRALAQDAGFDAHLVKPVEPARLAEALEAPASVARA